MKETKRLEQKESIIEQLLYFVVPTKAKLILLKENLNIEKQKVKAN